MRLLLCALCTLLSAATYAVPLQIPYQGQLADDSELIIADTTVEMIFTLYAGPNPGDGVLWTETHPAVVVHDGLFSVSLGSATSLSSALFASPEVWLGLKVGADSEMAPRTRLLSVPYAIEALGAKTVSVDNLTDLIQLWAVTPDADGDGYNKVSFGGTDCDDWNPTVHSGAPEICDGFDNNCDQVIDEGFNTEHYRDADGDGFGDASALIYTCNPPAGYVTDHTDCDDSNSASFPGAVEVCDGFDNDCDDVIDEWFTTVWYLDLDGDGAGQTFQSISSCTQPSGYVGTFGDCDDTNPEVFPGAVEVCDGIDNNCDYYTDPPGTPGCTAYYFDTDSDGWGSSFYYGCMCEDNEYRSPISGDCDDDNFNVHPDAIEICDDGIDNDCDGDIDAADSDCF